MAATLFLAWPPLIRSSGLLLLDSVFKLSILRTQDNLGSKLSQIRIHKRICSLSLSFFPLLYCKQPDLSRSPSHLILFLLFLAIRSSILSFLFLAIRLDKIEAFKLLQLIMHVDLWDSRAFRFHLCFISLLFF